MLPLAGWQIHSLTADAARELREHEEALAAEKRHAEALQRTKGALQEALDLARARVAELEGELSAAHHHAKEGHEGLRQRVGELEKELTNALKTRAQDVERLDGELLRFFIVVVVVSLSLCAFLSRMSAVLLDGKEPLHRQKR